MKKLFGVVTFFVFYYGSNAAEKNGIVFANPDLKTLGEFLFLGSYNYNLLGLKRYNELSVRKKLKPK